MEKYLSNYKVGQSGTIKKIVAEGSIKRRLYDMGVTPSCKVVLKKFAPMGDPMEINLRGYSLTLRLAEASCIMMED